MAERRAAWLRLGFDFLFLISTIPVSAKLIPDIYPFRNVSSLYLLILVLALFLNYRYHVAKQSRLRPFLLGIAAFLVGLIFLRGLKYSVFSEVDILARQLWYLYYIPILAIPQLFFFTALHIHTDNIRILRKRWAWTAIVTALFIVLVVTNDLHQWVFRFNDGFMEWDSQYTLGVVFYLLTVWQYVLYLMAIVCFLMKCSVSSVRKNAWLLLLPFTMGVGMLLLLAVDRMPKINGFNLIEFPEAVAFMVAGVLDGCMSLGLIPNNREYRKIMKISSVAAQIMDTEGNVIYQSDAAVTLTPEQMQMDDRMLLDENTVLNKMEFPGGFGIWQEDIRELNRLRHLLDDIRDRLSEEAVLIRLQNELREKQAAIEQRTRLYDEISRRTQQQSLSISVLAERALHTEDIQEKEVCKREIILLGAYLKRFANLMLLSDSHAVVSTAELGLALAESLHYLNYFGIPAENYNTADGDLPAEAALCAYSVFEELIEDNLSHLQGVYVHLSESNDGVLLKLTLENAQAAVRKQQRLEACGIALYREQEDEVSYLHLLLPKGGRVS